MKPEAILMQQAKHYFQLKQIYYKRINAGLIKTKKENTFYRSVEAGTADFICCIRSRFVACEAKSAQGRQSPAQKLEEQKVKAAGGFYVLFHSIEELDEAFRVIERTLTT